MNSTSLSCSLCGEHLVVADHNATHAQCPRCHALIAIARDKAVEWGKVFISYRREDSADSTGRIYDRLKQHYGIQNLIRDVDSIPTGCDFRQYLSTAVGECKVLLVVIGRNWRDITGPSGKRRLNDPKDFVRLEIEAALQKSIPIIPIVVQGASFPDEDDLPESVKGLAVRNGLQVRPDPDFHRDVDRLIDRLDALLNHELLNRRPAESCPDMDDLERLASNQLATAKAIHIQRHLNVCPACNEIVKALSEAFRAMRVQNLEQGRPADSPQPVGNTAKQTRSPSLDVESTSGHADSPCPCTGELKSYLFNRQNADKANRRKWAMIFNSAVAGHVAKCDHCRDRLRQLEQDQVAGLQNSNGQNRERMQVEETWVEVSPSSEKQRLDKKEIVIVLESRTTGTRREVTMRQLDRDNVNAMKATRNGEVLVLTRSLYDDKGRPVTCAEIQTWPKNVQSVLFNYALKLSGPESKDEAEKSTSHASE